MTLIKEERLHLSPPIGYVVIRRDGKKFETASPIIQANADSAMDEPVDNGVLVAIHQADAAALGVEVFIGQRWMFNKYDGNYAPSAEAAERKVEYHVLKATQLLCAIDEVELARRVEEEKQREEAAKAALAAERAGKAG